MRVPRVTWRDAGRRPRLLPVAFHRRPAIAAAWRVLTAAAIATAVVVLPGCTTTRPQKLPGGDAGLLVDCSGANLTWTHCFREAGDKCPHGYAIVKRDGKGGGRLVSGDFLQVFGNKADHRKLLIRCTTGRPAPPIVPTAPSAPAQS